MKNILFLILLFPGFDINGQGLFLKISNPQVSGNQVTYDISVANFDSIAAMTYCISYDQSKLSFNRFKNIISFMSIFDFSTESPNYICDKWIDFTLETVSLPDNTVLYQVVFNMLQGIDGDVCFSQEPFASEFLIGEIQMPASFFIIDDCHPDTTEVFLTANREINPDLLGLHIRQNAYSDQIQFSLDAESTIEFNLFDIMGRRIQHIPMSDYLQGYNSIQVQSPIQKGIYFLSVKIQHQQFTVKIIFP